MATIKIDYGALSQVSRNASALARAADSYANDLNRKVLNKLDKVPCNSTDLANARYYVKKKISALEHKQVQYEGLAKQVTEFSEKARRIDGEVEKMLERKQENFLKKNEHLRIDEWKAKLLNFLVDVKNKFPVLEMIGNCLQIMQTELSNLWDNIQYWYHCEGGREVVQIVTAIAGAILAVVIFVASFPVSGFFGVCAVIGAVIGLVNAGANIASSIMSLVAARNGDPAWARIYGNMNKFSDVLRSTNFNNRFLNKLSNGLAFALDTTELFCDIVGFVDAGLKLRKVLKDGSLKKMFDRLKNFKTFFKEAKWQETLDWNIYGKPCGVKMEMVLNKDGTVATRYSIASIKRGFKWLLSNAEVDCFSTKGLWDIADANWKDLDKVLGREYAKIGKDIISAIEAYHNRDNSGAIDSTTKAFLNGLPFVSQINDLRIIINDGRKLLGY